MSETLIIRFNANEEHVDWVVANAAGDVGPAVRGTLAEAAPLAANKRLMAVAPADSVLRVQANIPLKGTAKIRQALPFALEEQIAGDIEAQHFAFNKASTGNGLPVAIIERRIFQEWLDRLSEVGLKPDTFKVESDGVPAPPATISILIEESNAIIRDHHGAFIVTDTGSLQLVLEMLLDQHSETMENDATMVPVNVISYCDEETHNRFAELWERLRLRAENVDVMILPSGALPFLAAQLLQGEGIDLLQGEFKPKSEINIEWGPWRRPAILLAACLILVFALKGIEFWQLNTAETKLDAAAAEILQNTFPDAGEVSNPWDVLKSRLGTATATTTSTSGPGFAESISVLAKAFSNSSELRMQTIAYRAGVLDLQLLAPDVDTLDKLRQEIADSGNFTATIQSANPDKDVIKGRIQITAVAQ